MVLERRGQSREVQEVASVGLIDWLGVGLHIIHPEEDLSQVGLSLQGEVKSIASQWI